MTNPTEHSKRADRFTPSEYFQWRSTEIENMSLVIDQLEASLPISAPFHTLAETFLFDERSKALTGEFHTDEETSRAELLNILSTYNSKRFSGKPYATHPAMVGNIIARYGIDLNYEEKLERKKLASLHDVIEEGPIRYAKKHIKAPNSILAFPGITDTIHLTAATRRLLDHLFPDQQMGRSVVELMEPVVPLSKMQNYELQGADPYLVEYAHFTRMLQLSQSPAVIDVEVGDRVDDITDTEYILNNSRLTPKQKGEKLEQKLARCYHTVAEIEYTASSPLVEMFYNVYDAVVEENANLINTSSLDARIEQFGDFLSDNSDQIDQTVEDYLEAVLDN